MLVLRLLYEQHSFFYPTHCTQSVALSNLHSFRQEWKPLGYLTSASKIYLLSLSLSQFAIVFDTVYPYRLFTTKYISYSESLFF